MADAAHLIMSRGLEFTGNFCIDEQLLRDSGVTDFARYAMDPNVEPLPDFFVD
jgi:citronellol/citronellal dehydrogenase